MTMQKNPSSLHLLLSPPNQQLSHLLFLLPPPLTPLHPPPPPQRRAALVPVRLSLRLRCQPDTSQRESCCSLTARWQQSKVLDRSNTHSHSQNDPKPHCLHKHMPSKNTIDIYEWLAWNTLHWQCLTNPQTEPKCIISLYVRYWSKVCNNLILKTVILVNIIAN